MILGFLSLLPSKVIFQAASLIISVLVVLLAIFRYQEYRNSIQRGLYSELVGEEFHFQLFNQQQKFTVENVAIDGGWRPSTWTTLVHIEFDIDDFPWDRNEDDRAEAAIRDLYMSLNLLTKRNTDVLDADLMHSYKSPSLAVVFPTTDLFLIREFLRKTQMVIGDVFEFHDENEMSMVTFNQYLAEALEFAADQISEQNEGDNTGN